MTIEIGDKFPNLEGQSQSALDFDLYKYLGDSWGLLLFYPHTGNAVGATDLAAALSRSRQFEERGVRICGATVMVPTAPSNESAAGMLVSAHRQYCHEVQEWSQLGPSAPLFPCVLLSADQARNAGIPLLQTQQQQNQSTGAPLVGSITYILKPDRTVACVLHYPSTSGRHFDELIRLLDSLQLHVNMNVMTPADWQSGESVLVDSQLSDEQAKDLFGADGVTLSYQDANSRTVVDEDGNLVVVATTPSTTTPRPDLPYLRWTKDPTWFAPDV